VTKVLLTRRFLGDNQRMQLAVISDIHGNIDALNAVLGDIERRDIKKIVNLGDCLSGPLDARATADRLMALNIPTVRGNHDRMLFEPGAAGLWEDWIIADLSDAHIDWLRTFPATIEENDVLYCHATPNSDHENWLDFRGPQQRLIARDLEGVQDRLGGAAQRVICCGHTHAPRVVRLPGGPTIINPGAVGMPAYLDERTEPPFIHQTGSPDARYAILRKSGAAWQPDLVTVAYDASKMIELARAKGADSWAQALETGWIA
jgi:putative phosphoesterase